MTTAEEDEAASSCVICCEPWSNTGPHRLTSLKCGHLFGQSCIEKWIARKASSAACPECNTPAARKDIRPIYARILKAVDASRLVHLQRQLDDATQGTASLQAALDAAHLKIGLLQKDNDALKTQIKLLMQQRNTQTSSSSSSSSSSSLISPASPSTSSAPLASRATLAFDFVAQIPLANNASCKGVTACQDKFMVFSTLQLQGNQSFAYGFICVDMADMSYRHPAPTKHTCPIQAMVPSPRNDGMLLSVSWDKTMRLITSKGIDCAVFHLPAPGNAVVFAPNPFRCIAACTDGHLLVFDPIAPKQAVNRFMVPGVGPIHSMIWTETGLLLARFSGVVLIRKWSDNPEVDTVDLYTCPPGEQILSMATGSIGPGSDVIFMLTLRSMATQTTAYELRQLHHHPDQDISFSTSILYNMKAPHFQRVVSKSCLFSIPSSALHDTTPPPAVKRQRGIERFLIPTPRGPNASSPSPTSSSAATVPTVQECLVACIPDEATRSVTVMAFEPGPPGNQWTSRKVKELQTNADVPVLSTLYVADSNAVVVQTEKQCLVYKL